MFLHTKYKIVSTFVIECSLLEPVFHLAILTVAVRQLNSDKGTVAFSPLCDLERKSVVDSFREYPWGSRRSLLPAESVLGWPGRLSSCPFV